MVYMYHSFLIHSSADGHLGCFHVLAMINSAVMSHRFLKDFTVKEMEKDVSRPLLLRLFSDGHPDLSRHPSGLSWLCTPYCPLCQHGWPSS